MGDDCSESPEKEAMSSRESLLFLSCVVSTLFLSAKTQGESWKDKTIEPVTNPFYFEAPQVNT